MAQKADSGLIPQMPKALLVSLTAIMGALCCIVTMMFQIYVPATYGYFNLGEIAVFISALLFGPVVGAIAGGVGSMTADILLGFPVYAPATLIIKGLEGFVVGYLGYGFRKRLSLTQLRYLGVGIGGGLAVALGLIGWLLLSVIKPETLWGVFDVYFPSWFWLLMAVYIGSVTIILTLRYDAAAAWSATSMLLGGFLMITGYFLFQWLMFSQAALIELPVNLVQVIIGIMVALPVNERVRKAFVGFGWVK